MNQQSLRKTVPFWIALLLIFVIIFLFLATYFRWIDVSFVLGPFRFSHWPGWIGAGFIAIYTPVYYFWKRRNPNIYKTLSGIHVFGNLVSVGLITVHFAQQISRPEEAFPDLGTGILLYILLFLLLVTGFVQRFHIAKNTLRYRSVHISMMTFFYLTIVIHVLHGIHVI
jgi:hypothetical protein